MKVKQNPVAAAVTLTLLSVTMAAQAQQAPAAPAKPEAAQLDQVVITGIRASLETAANIKKNATAVVDAVSAEDVGKLPDSDVGQSLGRIPGISVGRSFGQGSSVSVRGSDPQMTYTTLNGQTIASTGWYDQQDVDRSFNYSLLPSELIGGMEVYKSSQADLTEGGIGGTVIVKTRKPLDMASGSGVISAKLGKGTVSTDLNKDVSGLFSWRDSQKKFGVLIAGAVENGDYIRRGVEADMGWSGDVVSTVFIQERKRNAVNVTLQARPVEGLDLGLNYLRLKLSADNANTGQFLFAANVTCEQKNAKGLCIKGSRSTAPAESDTFIQTWLRTGEMTSDSLNLNGSFNGAGYKIEAVAGSTKATGGISRQLNFGAYGDKLPAFTGSFDATGHQISIQPSKDQSVSVSNLPAKMNPENWARSEAQPNSDKETYAQADLTLDLNWGVLNSFKAGLRSTNHTYEKRKQRAVFPTTLIQGDSASLYGDGTVAIGLNGWDFPRPNIGAMVALGDANSLRWLEDRSGYAELKEKNTGLYGMFEYETGKLRGNFGLRYAHTDVSSKGYKFDGSKPSADDMAIGKNDGWNTAVGEEKSKYSEWLPSLNGVYALDKNTNVRFAVAKTMTRPNFANMFQAKVQGYGDDRANNEAMAFGTVALKPMTSKQFDLGLEYYYGKGNMVAVAYFHKSIDNFVTTNTLYDQKLGVIDPLSKKDSWAVSRYVNAGGGKIDGIEAQINHAFDNGFGVAANYTYSDARAPSASYEDQLNMFTLSSKHNANLVGYYETASYSARLAYNWRSKYMIRENPYWYSNRMHDAFGSLDLSLGWNINNTFKLSFEAINLTKQDDIQYGAAEPTSSLKSPMHAGFPAWSFKGETTYRLGVSAKF